MNPFEWDFHSRLRFLVRSFRGMLLIAKTIDGVVVTLVDVVNGTNALEGVGVEKGFNTLILSL
eukprot:SAG31_NODE_19605_length_597_cov_0.929719_2_plen_62_part_01